MAALERNHVEIVALSVYVIAISRLVWARLLVSGLILTLGGGRCLFVLSAGSMFEGVGFFVATRLAPVLGALGTHHRMLRRLQLLPMSERSEERRVGKECPV